MKSSVLSDYLVTDGAVFKPAYAQGSNLTLGNVQPNKSGRSSESLRHIPGY